MKNKLGDKQNRYDDAMENIQIAIGLLSGVVKKYHPHGNEI